MIDSIAINNLATLRGKPPCVNINSMARKMATHQICIFFVVAVCLLFTTCLATKRYQPNWEDLDKRALPSWYDDVKFGIFIHWGVFSVPSFGSEWFWLNWKDGQKSVNEFMQKNYPPNFTYQDFAREFTAEFFNASEWAEIFKIAGAKYVVLTSKHHEGFTLWPSKYSFSWNALDVGPTRDIVGELSKAVRDQGLTFGLYYSLYEWFNPMWIQDRDQKFNSTSYVDGKAMPALYELVNTYKPDVIWSDGDWEAPDDYWKSKEFLAWLYNDSPVKDTVVANDRWGRDIPCHHGGFYTCTDRYNPRYLLHHKWENCMTIDKKSWGFRRNAKLTDYLTLKQLVNELVVTVACGGNLLLNVGPTKEGIISPIYQERLRGMGEWLAYNGDAIYNTSPWTKQNDTHTEEVWYTKSKTTNDIFITFFNWPKHDQLVLASISIPDDNKVALLEKDSKRVLKVLHDQAKSLTTIQLPPDGNKGAPAWVLTVSKNSK